MVSRILVSLSGLSVLLSVVSSLSLLFSSSFDCPLLLPPLLLFLLIERGTFLDRRNRSHSLQRQSWTR